jgi:hypothetical protein
MEVLLRNVGTQLRDHIVSLLRRLTLTSFNDDIFLRDKYAKNLLGS